MVDAIRDYSKKQTELTKDLQDGLVYLASK